MINKLKYATIADIGVFDLIFYEKKNEVKLIDFCIKNGITFLPSKDRSKLYQLVSNKFELRDLSQDLCIEPYERIFDPVTLDKFSVFDYNEVHFIVEENLIKGVIHIIDYNSEFIQVELYRALFKFEVNLRKLLVKENFGNEDFINWIKTQVNTTKTSKKVTHWKQRLNDIDPSDPKQKQKRLNERKEFKPFQTFYLSELLQFAASKDVIDKMKVNIDKIRKLRNKIAHSNSFTTYTKEQGKLIYNYTKLSEYVQEINAFFQAYEYLLIRLEQ